MIVNQHNDPKRFEKYITQNQYFPAYNIQRSQNLWNLKSVDSVFRYDY